MTIYPALKLRVYKRLHHAGLWAQAEHERDRMMREARSIGLSKEEAQDYTYRMLDEMFPAQKDTTTAQMKERAEVIPTAQMYKLPGYDSGMDAREDSPLQGVAQQDEQPPKQGYGQQDSGEGNGAVFPANVDGIDALMTSDVKVMPLRPETSTALKGLSDIPASWPTLPPNASLASELQWVQASRIDVVEELPSGGFVVHLDRADRPAPSKSALGWLETSIRAYSKFVDVAAKTTSQLEDEKEHVRRERLAIEDIRRLLGEMVADATHAQ